MKILGRNFLIGLSILLLVMVSVRLVVWLVTTLESWLRSLWLSLLPKNRYLPGFAIVSFVLITLIIDFSARLPGISQSEVAVHLSMSYQSGGYLAVLPKDRLETVDMDPGDALRLIMSAGLGQRFETT